MTGPLVGGREPVGALGERLLAMLLPRDWLAAGAGDDVAG